MDGESKFILFLELYKNKLKLKNNLQNEIQFLYTLTKKVSSRLIESNNLNIITSNEYKIHMQDVADLVNQLNTIPKNITIKFIYNYSQYKLMLFVAKIKLKFINIVQTTGCHDILILSKLFINIDLDTLSDKYVKLVEFYKEVFNATGCDVYDNIDNMSNHYKLNYYGNNLDSEQENIILTNFQANIPTCNKMTIFTKSIIHKLHGSKLYIPYGKKLLVIYGYFIKDDLNINRSLHYFDTKNIDIKKRFDEVDLPKSFKFNFINQISLRDLILLNVDELQEECTRAHQELEKIKLKDITKLIKYFVLNDEVKQQFIITVLVLNQEDKRSHYLAYMLYDIIQSDSTTNYNSHNNFLSNLHWNVQRLFKDAKSSVNDINNTFNNIDELAIPYEKRIHLMKADDRVKSKALDKLKEINSSKGGETNAKAQQYVDGILKIPFGIYKEDKINIFFKRTINKIEAILYQLNDIIVNLEKDYLLNDTSLYNINQYTLLVGNFNKIQNNSVRYDIQINKLRNIYNIINISSNKINISNLENKKQYYNWLSKTTAHDLKNICDGLSIKKSGKKVDLINRICNYNIDGDKFQEIFNLMDNTTINIKNCKEYQTITSLFCEIFNFWDDYKTNEGEHLKYIDRTLDNAVYGLDSAKIQIKRIFAQWMTGKTKGYVLGLEGPPGTGKTTLAKRGISECLLGENDEYRPFIFMAMGGSSNGSTLEGHNYTYVGSQWGKIVDSLIEAKCMNPIIYIDELDKISKTEHGKEITGILTHITDGSQNEEFSEKYFAGIKFDISKCLIIFSYNNPDNIDKILLNRIQRIQIPALSKYDKLVVSKKHILPEIYSDIGILPEYIIWEDDVLFFIIHTYTYEAGARKVKEILYDIIRQINLDYLNNKLKYPFNISKKYVENVLFELPKIFTKNINDTDLVGLVNGLYATNGGLGGITIIETFKTPSNNSFELILTGQQGDVMKESMHCAKTVVFNILPTDILAKLKKEDKFSIHIHCPDTATPKDGPSAGTAITLGILSLLTGYTIKKDYAITGEIDLNGNVKRIGGLMAKTFGAKYAGVKTVLCPYENFDDLEKIRQKDNAPEDEKFKVICINTIYDAIQHMMNGDLSIFNNML